MVSLERRLRPGLGVLLGYVHKKGGGNGAWRDVSGQYAPAVYSDTAGTDASGREIAIERLVSAPETRGFLLTSPTEMFTRYDGFLLQVTRPMQGRFQLTGSLVLSPARGRLGSSLNGPRGEQQSVAQGFGQNPNDFVNSDGRLIEDRPVAVKVQASELVAGRVPRERQLRPPDGPALGTPGECLGGRRAADVPPGRGDNRGSARGQLERVRPRAPIRSSRSAGARPSRSLSRRST